MFIESFSVCLLSPWTSRVHPSIRYRCFNTTHTNNPLFMFHLMCVPFCCFHIYFLTVLQCEVQFDEQMLIVSGCQDFLHNTREFKLKIDIPDHPSFNFHPAPFVTFHSTTDSVITQLRITEGFRITLHEFFSMDYNWCSIVPIVRYLPASHHALHPFSFTFHLLLLLHPISSQCTLMFTFLYKKYYSNIIYIKHIKKIDSGKPDVNFCSYSRVVPVFQCKTVPWSGSKPGTCSLTRRRVLHVCFSSPSSVWNDGIRSHIRSGSESVYRCLSISFQRGDAMLDLRQCLQSDERFQWWCQWVRHIHRMLSSREHLALTRTGYLMLQTSITDSRRLLNLRVPRSILDCVRNRE